MPAEFKIIFARLRKILQAYSKRLAVTEDSPERYCLTGGVHPTHKKPMPIAWVQIGKAYVSFHHMGLYGYEGLSKELQKRRQGKTCLNFKVADEKLFEEVEQLTAESFATFKKAGFMPEVR